MKSQTAQTFRLSNEEADQVTLRTIEQLLVPLSNEVEACIGNYKRALETQLPMMLKTQMTSLTETRMEKLMPTPTT